MFDTHRHRARTTAHTTPLTPVRASHRRGGLGAGLFGGRRRAGHAHGTTGGTLLGGHTTATRTPRTGLFGSRKPRTTTGRSKMGGLRAALFSGPTSTRTHTTRTKRSVPVGRGVPLMARIKRTIRGMTGPRAGTRRTVRF
jgi:hypothetical protein